MKRLLGFSRFSKFIAVFIVVALIAGLGFQFASPLREVVAGWVPDDLTTVEDVDGPDDYPGQKDLNFLQYYYPAPYTYLYMNWGFDNTDWSGNNTGDGCALFDTNNNGFADYSYCATVNGLPAKLIYKQLWSCGDSRSDRCALPINVVLVSTDDPLTDTNASYDFYADPFSSNAAHITGNTCSKTTDPWNCYVWDTRIMATIKLSDMPGENTPRFLNVCSYPSEQPNSDPSDCIFDYIGFVDVQVTKTDFDYSIVSRRIVGDLIDYKIRVEYPTEIAGTGAIARNVVMTDTLDAFLKYRGFLTINPAGLTPNCIEPTALAGGQLVCSVATMTPGQWFEVSYKTEILTGASTAGLIEIGSCDQSTRQGVNAVTGEPGPVDVCNVVSVTTTNDLDLTNNADSDPADVGAPTAVDLLYFEGTGAQNAVILEWATASELDTIGFNLYRRGRLDGTMRPINNLLVQAQVPGAVEGASYIFKVDGLKAGKFYYFWLEDVDMYGNTTLHGPIYVKAKRNDPIN
jgi:hypothetical protein